MAFSPAQYQAVTDKLTAGVETLARKIPEVTAAAHSVTTRWYVPDPVKEMVVWLAEKIVSIAEWVHRKILDLLEGAAAPLLLFSDAMSWETARGKADAIASELSPQLVSISSDWQGAAATAYANAIKSQSAAASQIASIADATASALTWCAAAGAAFYVALGVIVVKFTISLIIAIAAEGSVVFSGEGLAIVAMDAGVDAGLIISAVAALTALLTAQAKEMVALHGLAVDPTAFPGGRWPAAVTA